MKSDLNWLFNHTVYPVNIKKHLDTGKGQYRKIIFFFPVLKTGKTHHQDFEFQ